jgi:hypothetical protein
MKKQILRQGKNTLDDYQTEIEHGLPNWHLVDFRKEEVEDWVAGFTYKMLPRV